METSSQNFPPSRRLHYTWEYRRFFGRNEMFRTSECIVFRVANEHETSRLGITLKARGRSVDRNLIKRTVREFFRTSGVMGGSFDYNVVIPASKKLDSKYQQCLRNALVGELASAVRRSPSA